MSVSPLNVPFVHCGNLLRFMVQEPAIDGRIMAGRTQHVTLQIASDPVQRREYGET